MAPTYFFIWQQLTNRIRCMWMCGDQFNPFSVVADDRNGQTLIPKVKNVGLFIFYVFWNFVYIIKWWHGILLPHLTENKNQKSSLNRPRTYPFTNTKIVRHIRASVFVHVFHSCSFTLCMRLQANQKFISSIRRAKKTKNRNRNNREPVPNETKQKSTCNFLSGSHALDWTTIFWSPNKSIRTE